ncbi:MAG: aminotransferase class III-fold pyridoxal phosphate-dependent enzyme [Acetobacteraceae bacterium]|nr:aminotransferase class III-fold pyridoxal phosphate-dependent enzyme [Acetobacteraceae bacterium]
MSPLDAAPPRPNSDLEAAVMEARGDYARKRPRSAALHADARQSMAGGNTRSTLLWAPFPITMVRGEGCRLWDADGREYLDFLGEYTAGLFGHSERRILDAVKAAFDRGVGFGAMGEDEVRFAALVCAKFPSIERVRFTNSGTEANLMALTAARAFTGRDTVMVMRGGYHGGVLTFGMTASGQPSRVNAPFPIAFATYNDAEGAAAAIREAGDSLAAVILEPMLGSGGCIPATQDFLAAVRAATRETGAILIFDEVMTSRHSHGGLQARTGVTPDMTTLGKYIAGGMNVGAFGGREDVMAVFDGHRPGALGHAGTFNNNVWTMAAGRVALGEIFTAEVADALYARGEALRERLNAICAAAGVPMGFTGRGSMLSVHFRTPLPTTAYLPGGEEELRRELFFLDLLESGIYLARRGMMALSLPVDDAACEALAAAVAEFVESRAPVLR